jgi:hypothetical protein
LQALGRGRIGQVAENQPKSNALKDSRILHAAACSEGRENSVA